MKNNLPYPFNEAFEHGDSIDYRIGAWSQENDHTYVEKLGYKPEMLPDCSYHARGLRSFSLSSYGDWGTFYADAAEKEKEIFLDMYEKDIIHLWRIRAYINGEVYDYDDGKWMSYVSSAAWVECNDPYKNSVEKLKQE